MNTSGQGSEDPRWQYKVLWRYGALLLVVVGLLAMGFGAAGVTGTPVDETLLSLGFISLVAGVVLPRIEGTFTAGPAGISGAVRGVRDLDPRWYAISGPALADDVASTAEADEAHNGSTNKPVAARITIGDVWDALEAAGIHADGAGMGHAYFTLGHDRSLDMPNRGFADWGTASDDLLAALQTWGIRPLASGKYKPDRAVRPEYADSRWGHFTETPGRRGGASDRPVTPES